MNNNYIMSLGSIDLNEYINSFFFFFGLLDVVSFRVPRCIIMTESNIYQLNIISFHIIQLIH